MTNIQTILVAYDGTYESQKALDFAVEFAKERKYVELHLVTVYQPVYTMAYTPVH